jgi:hypothetical protein
MVALYRSCYLVFFCTLLPACGPSTEEKDEVTDEPKRYAAALCAGAEECSCYAHLGPTADCMTELEQRFVALVEDGMEFDKDCFDSVISEARLAAGCATDSDLAALDSGGGWHCTVLRGDRGIGEACTDRIYDLVPFWVNECDKGLICYDGACAREGTTGPVRSLGSECPAGWQASCHNGLLCGSNGICREPPALSEVCTSPFDCFDPDLYCRGWGDTGEGVCSPHVELGGSCDPRDWFACGFDDVNDGARLWCDPRSTVCVAESPAVCWALDFPRARGE